MVFASLVAQGAKGAGDCPSLGDRNSLELDKYLKQFVFEL
jgi:hypothetical protein